MRDVEASQMQARWYVARSHPSKERFAEAQLQNQGYKTYLPLMRAQRKQRKGYISVHKPLFSGYVFVRLNLEKDRWQSVGYTYGVANLVSFSSRPAPLPSGFVDRLQSLQADDGAQSFEEKFQIGDTAQLVGGPFDRFIGTVLSQKPDGRIVLLMQLLNGSIKVDVESRQLIQVKDEPGK